MAKRTVEYDGDRAMLELATLDFFLSKLEIKGSHAF